jgi:hypothetical protein
MRHKYAWILAAVFGAVLSLSSVAVAQSMSQDQQAQDQQAQDPSQAATGSADQALPVSGTAVSVDPQEKSITVTDSASGTDRTFSVMKEDEIQDIKPGDKVSVTPDQSNVSSAQKVEKEEGERP